MFLTKRIVERKLLEILAEDIGQGDVTTSLLVPAGTTAEAVVVAKEAGVLAGMEEANILVQSLGIESEGRVADGEKIAPKQVLMKLFGDAHAILAVERTLLNILSRMSGIATVTRSIVEWFAKAKLKTRVACTRKTAPGLLYFDKKAVWVGGGDTHRLHLDDMVLIKDNHIVVAGGVKRAVERARACVSFSKKIEVEVTKIEDVLKAFDAGADIVMLDNFSPAKIEKVVSMLRQKKRHGRILLEASGGITVENAVVFASKGVDIVSLGELTQSPRALDMSLEIIKTKPA